MALNFPASPALYEVYTENNRSWTWNGRYWQATSVTTGYTGSQGIQGIQGETGFVGSRGDLGYTGSQGDVGFVGSRGFTGDKGDTGDRGPTGFVGSRGDNSTGNLSITDHTINGTVVNRNITFNPLGSASVVSNSKFMPAGNNTVGLGDSAHRWTNIYVNSVVFADGTFVDTNKIVMGGTPPTRSTGSPGDKAGLIAFDTNYLYYCLANYDATTHIWRRVPWLAGTW